MNRAVRIAICEDKPEDLLFLQKHLQQSAACRGVDFTLSSFSSAEALLKDFMPGQFDLLFLDIYLDQITGLQAAQHIREAGDDCQIVFTTTSRDFALEGYGVRALHYLVKPYAVQSLEEALDRALMQIRDLDQQTITLMVDRRNRSIALRDIVHIESQNKQCHIHTTQGEILCTRLPMDQMVKLLPMPPFLRCHRSAVVNLGHVGRIDRDFVMQNGDIVCVRQVELREIKEQYMRYLMNITRYDLQA